MKTSDKILHTIKREGNVTAKYLADKFEMTTMGARQHLQALEDDGLIEFYDVKVKVGRPTRHWTLTPDGHEQFIDRHNDLAVQIIDAVESIYGKQGLKKIAEEREEHTLRTYSEVLKDCRTLEEKLTALVQLREDEGYMVELQKAPDHFLLIENHCPICRAATRCPEFCQSELHIFQILLQNSCNIVRQEHIVSGQRRCTYKITRL
ncbi:helix-turn-helix transcriptional regulator [Vibrio salinus]|uniref:helix-turn-helix transcriptional regulator n=1 Tax=Vibrio salinus TaxID=2899784 RepID=UPI001E60C532|nr:metalloregulator ArsR/SmtB family transcription factor [Vibrio salinus]MCE0493935.1 transcriptional regulator [Vibrio salinus]